jgi:hypothetical protein
MPRIRYKSSPFIWNPTAGQSIRGSGVDGFMVQPPYDCNAATFEGCVFSIIGFWLASQISNSYAA